MDVRPRVSMDSQAEMQWQPVAEIYGGLWKDIVQTVVLFFKISWRRQVNTWIFTPFYVTQMLGFLYVIAWFIAQSEFTFPASVTYMILVFVGLLFCEVVLGPRNTQKIVKIADLFTGFLGRHMNIFFTANFIVIPLSPRVHRGEVAVIVVLFFLGWFAAMMVVAWSCRALQALFRTTRISETERSAELEQFAKDEHAETKSLPPYSARLRAEDSDKMLADEDYMDDETPPPPQNTRPYRWAKFLKRHIDFMTYVGIFLFLGLPLYYARDVAFFLHISINVLSYLAACKIPDVWKRVFNPVLVTSGLTILFIYLFGLSKGRGIDASLIQYSGNAKYSNLLSGKAVWKQVGAGDVLQSLLEASVVAFALPMFKYRRDLRVHIFVIIVIGIVLAFVSLTAYPAFAYIINIAPRRAISFTSRSLASALAAPAVANLGGDQPAIVILAIFSGILGAVFGQQFLDFMLIPKDDYVTRGITLGMNSSAIVTAVLVKKDPRAAALSTLSFCLFGSFVVALSGWPVVQRFVQREVGLLPNTF